MRPIKPRVWFLAIAAVVGLAVLLWWPRDRSSSAAQPSQGAQGAQGAPPRTPVDDPPPDPAAADADAQQEAILSADVNDPRARAAAGAALNQTIRIYRETMVYPLWSRPADGSNEHLTRWNQPISVGQPFAVDAEKREIEATAQIDRVFAAPDAAVSILVTASYVADRTSAPLDQVAAELQWRDRKAETWVTDQAIPMRPADGGWTGALVPSQVEALRSPIREARIVAYAHVGEFAHEFTLDFAYAVEQPVVVHGIVSDRVADGNLELGLDVELTTAAPVGLQATLFESDGTTAIAVFDDRFFPKRAGRQVVTVRFFGKILHDHTIDGPYRLGAVHGYVYRQDLVPDQLFFDRADLPAMSTAAHSAAGFSAESYQSPEVSARLAHYEAIRAAMREGRDPPPPPSAP